MPRSSNPLPKSSKERSTLLPLMPRLSANTLVTSTSKPANGQLLLSKTPLRTRSSHSLQSSTSRPSPPMSRTLSPARLSQVSSLSQFQKTKTAQSPSLLPITTRKSFSMIPRMFSLNSMLHGAVTASLLHQNTMNLVNFSSHSVTRLSSPRLTPLPMMFQMRSLVSQPSSYTSLARSLTQLSTLVPEPSKILLRSSRNKANMPLMSPAMPPTVRRRRRRPLRKRFTMNCRANTAVPPSWLNHDMMNPAHFLPLPYLSLAASSLRYTLIDFLKPLFKSIPVNHGC
jgi:hypothetical protein